MTVFCPQCWRRVAETAQRCPRCGADLDAEVPYEVKLARALAHPVAETRALVAEILGRRHASVVLSDLVARLDVETDMGALAAVLTALGHIAECRAAPALIARLSRPLPLIAALAGVQALGELAEAGCMAARDALAGPPLMNLASPAQDLWKRRGGNDADRASRPGSDRTGPPDQ